MKPFLLTLLLCAALPLSAAPVPPSAGADAQKAIRYFYARQDAAIARHDEPNVLAGCAPDYKEVHTEPKVRGMAFAIADLRPMIHSMLYFAKTASRKTVIQETTFTPDGVTVTIHQHLVLWMAIPKQHKYGRVVTDTENADTWVKGKDGWRDKQSLVLAGHTTVLLRKTPPNKTLSLDGRRKVP